MKSRLVLMAKCRALPISPHYLKLHSSSKKFSYIIHQFFLIYFLFQLDLFSHLTILFFKTTFSQLNANNYSFGASHILMLLLIFLPFFVWMQSHNAHSHHDVFAIINKGPLCWHSMTKPNWSFWQSQ
jgi:hypothetical protein